MEKFIPYEKLSKKERRKLDQAKRRSWGNINPVTKKPPFSKAYNRAKTRSSSSGLLFDDHPCRGFFAVWSL